MSNLTADATDTEINSLDGLTKLQKLAAFLIILGPEEAAAVLSGFAPRQVEQIMGEMAKIEFVSAEVQRDLVKEFSAITLQAVTSAVGGVEKAQHVLERSLGPVKAREVLGRVAPSSQPTPLMDELRSTNANGILQMLRGEHAQTWALILGQLEAQNSAEIFRTMDPAFRAEVMRRMARLEPIAPEVLDQLIKGLLTRRTEVAARHYVAANGTSFLTDIMKKFDRKGAADALEALAKKDPELSASIRKMMFIFEDLVQLDQSMLTIILREVDFNTLAVAMKDCPQNLNDAVFRSITKRAAESLEENIRFMPKVRRKEIDEAREKVMLTVFDLERKGEISLSREE